MAENIFQTLYNQTNTSQPILTGRKINIVDKEGKGIGSVDESELPHFLQQGYHVENAQEKEVNDYLDENKGISGSLKAAGYNAANELTLGALNPVVENTADKSTIAKIKGLQRDHSLAAGIGSGAGLVGSMFIPGMGLVGKAGRAAEELALGGRVAESFGSKALGAAARMGTEGAILAAPQAITEASFGDPQQAAEHLLYGLGAGAVLGGLSPAIKGISKSFINAVGAPIGYRMEAGLQKDLARMSEDQAERSIFTNQSKQLRGELNQINKETGIKTGRYLLDNGLVPEIGEDTTSYLMKASSNAQKEGAKIGEIVDKVKDAKIISRDEIINKLNNQLEEKYGNSAAFTQEYNKGKAYVKELDEQLSKFDGTTALEQNYNNELNKLNTITDPALRETQAKVINGLRDQLVNESKNITLGRLWKDSSELGNKAFKSAKSKIGDGDEISELLNDFRKTIRTTIKDEGSKAANELGIPDWTNQFEKANRNYRVATEIEKIAKNSADAASNRNFSLTDNIWGSALMGGNIAHAAANPVGALMGVGTAVGSKFLRENGNKILADYGNKASLYLADMAKKEAEGQLGRIPTLLKQFAKNTFSSTGALETGNAISRFISSDEKDPVKSYDQLVNKLQNANVNNSLTDALADGTPNIANAYKQVNNNVITYLNNVMPKDPNAGKPFAKPFKPTKTQLTALNDKMAVINNPFIVMDKLGSGKLNQNHMEALKTIYPKVYNNMVNQINEYGFSNPKMPYKQKLRLSMLTGSNLDPSLNNIPQYQALYQEENKAQPLANGKLKEIPGSQYTQQQRTEGEVDT